jgi:hypothetical protein
MDVFTAGETYVSALASGPADTVYCATSGRNSHVFIADAKQRTVTAKIDTIPGPISVHGAIALAPDGTVFVGTMCSDPQLEERKEKNLPFDGGHIYRYRPSGAGYTKDDLGMPLPGEGIYAMLLDAKQNLIFGISYPAGKFFVFDLQSAKTTDFREVSGPLNGFEKRLAICSALAQDAKGNVYFSGKGPSIYRYQPQERNLEILSAQLPAIEGRGSYQSIDVLLPAKDGTFYGADSDGYLFHFDPESGDLVNLGKVIRQLHIQGMTWGSDGRIFGVAGEYDGMPRTFAYDPAKHAFQLGGIPRYWVPGQVWNQKEYQLDCMEPIGGMVTTTSGFIVDGVLSRLGNVLVWEQTDE